MSHAIPEPSQTIERLLAEQNRLMGARWDSFESTVSTRFDRVEKKVDDLTRVHATLAEHASRIAGHDRELGELKRTQERDFERLRAEHEDDLRGLTEALEKRSDRMPLWTAAVIALAALGVSILGFVVK